MTPAYDDRFFAWVNLTALRSAHAVLPVVRDFVSVRSVVDVGCGQGAWLSVWQELGATDVLGLDGSYVAQDRLLIPSDRFESVDLTRPFQCDRRFDLAQSLEVAEHLPPAAAEPFIGDLCSLSDIVLFSAAQPGQGGEAHVNERTPSYWAYLFRGHGYEAFDAVRPLLATDQRISPWYRFNTVVYANAAGRSRLSPGALATRCDDPLRLDISGDLGWALRRMVLRPLPKSVVSWLSRAHYRLACAMDRQAA